MIPSFPLQYPWYMHPNILYFQSGGPTSVINSSFLGLCEAYKNLGLQGNVYVSHYGVSGLLEGKLEQVDLDNLPHLQYRPGSYLGSLRLKLDPNPNGEQALAIIKTLKEYRIDFVFPNGGNDSMDTTMKLSSFIKEHGLDTKVIGIPKTVDNDLYGCDHTPGFGSAAKYVANAVLSIAMDDLTYKKGRVNVIETMGRDSGFLAASSKLAALRGLAPDYIYVPEVPFDIPSFLTKAKKTYEEKGRCLIVVSEGIRDKEGTLIASASNRIDEFGHSQVGGVAAYLASLLEKEGIKSRGIELSVLNRASSFLPSLTDIEEAKGSAAFALESANKGESGAMVCIKRKEGKGYQAYYRTEPIERIANKVVYLDKRYINEEGDNILDSYIDYCAPLIKGNANPLEEDGLL